MEQNTGDLIKVLTVNDPKRFAKKDFLNFFEGKFKKKFIFFFEFGKFIPYFAA